MPKESSRTRGSYGSIQNLVAGIPLWQRGRLYVPLFSKNGLVPLYVPLFEKEGLGEITSPLFSRETVGKTPASMRIKPQSFRCFWVVPSDF